MHAFAAAFLLAVAVAGCSAATPATLSPTVSVTPGPVQTATPSPTPTALQTEAPTPAPTPSPTTAPLPTPTPSPVPQQSVAPGETVIYEFEGSEYVSADVPPGGRVRRVGTSVMIETTADSIDRVVVTWRLQSDALPPGAVIDHVDSRICGSGEGDFYEVYGPEGSEPEEYEVRPPEADGCWHFSDAPGDDLTFLGITETISTLTIDRVAYSVTFAE